MARYPNFTPSLCLLLLYILIFCGSVVPIGAVALGSISFKGFDAVLVLVVAARLDLCLVDVDA